MAFKAGARCVAPEVGTHSSQAKSYLLQGDLPGGKRCVVRAAVELLERQPTPADGGSWSNGSQYG